MNTTKKLVVLCMVALLGVVAVIPSTFSWYTRAATQSGGVLLYERNKLPISSGNVSITTQQYDTEDNKIKYNSKNEKEIKNAVSYSVEANSINYYKSTLTNNTNADAYVNMYLSGASNSAGLYVGSLEPTLNYKQVGTPMRKSESNSQIMVYFQKNTTGTQWSNVYVWAIHTVNGVLQTDSYIMTKSSTKYKYKGTGSNVDTYYCLLPENTKEFYFVKQAATSNGSYVPSGFDRTASITTFRPSTLYSLTGRTTDDNNNYAEFSTYTMSDALVAPTYYSSITTAVNRSIYLRLPAGTNYDSITYEKVGTIADSVLEIDSGIARVKVKNSDADGKKIKTTLTGIFGETMKFETTINVPATLTEFPIIQNVLVGAKSKTVVEWYAENKLSGDSQALGTVYWTR